MKGKSNGPTTPHLTEGSVLSDLGFSPAESLELQVKTEIYHELMQHIKHEGFSQQELRLKLGLHQPDVSKLLNGKLSRFSVTKLIKIAAKLDLGAEVRLTKTKRAKASSKVNSTARRPNKALANA